MENVFKLPTNDLLNIREWFEEFKSELHLQGNLPLPADDSDVMKLLGIDDLETFTKLKESVDLEKHLSDPEDVRVLPFKECNPQLQARKPILEISNQILQLNTFHAITKFKEKYYGNPLGKNVFAYRYQEAPPNDFPDIKPHEDVLISIRFYRPYSSSQIGRGVKPRFAEEFLVRGQQFLSELRDKVTCQCTGPFYDVSNDPNHVFPPLATDPGFFFITDTFYNDTRNPKNADYSEVILKWAETRKRGTFTAQFKTAKMEETKFLDLQVRIGFPQVYQHYGNCEHLFTFSWIKIIDAQDCLSSRYYPILRSLDLINKLPCGICGQREHVFVVQNSDRHMHDPTYLCRICFNSYHYIDGGEKVGEFKAYCVNPEPGKKVIVLSSEEEDESDELDESGETDMKMTNL